MESDTKLYDSVRYRHIDKDAVCYGHVMKSSCRLYMCGAPRFAESIRRHGMIMGRYPHSLFENLYAPIANIRLKTGTGYVIWMNAGMGCYHIYMLCHKS
jgi:hypothetical protein